MIPFLRRNIYWLLLTSLLLALAIYYYPRQPRLSPLANELFAPDLKLRATPVHVAFDKVRLDEALAAISKESRCTITANWHLLGGIGVNPETPVSAHAAGTVPLERAIDLLLRSLNILPFETVGAVFANENSGGPAYISIGPSDAIFNRPLVTVVYGVADLLAAEDDVARRAKSSRLQGLLQDQFHLSESGVSEGAITLFDDRLIIRTAPHRHRQIAEFLEQLRAPQH